MRNRRVAAFPNVVAQRAEPRQLSTTPIETPIPMRLIYPTMRGLLPRSPNCASILRARICRLRVSRSGTSGIPSRSVRHCRILAAGKMA
jgi:hypothetical protein